MITEGWMNHRGGRFTADMSDIEAHLRDKTKKAVRCPGCRVDLAFEKFKENRDDDNDIRTWTLKHDCGADLTIFNESEIVKPTFKQFLSESMKHKKKKEQMAGDTTHPFSVKILKKGPGKWPTLRGEIYEKDVLIGTFSRKAMQDGYIPPIEYKFRTEGAKNRFDDFADSNSIAETIEALMGLD